MPLVSGDGVSRPSTNHTTALSWLNYYCRICPGRWLAIDTVWITIASVLAVYNIRKAVDEDGNPIEPTTEYTTGLIRYVPVLAGTRVTYANIFYTSHPKPFKCIITPRSEGAKALIGQIEHDQPDLTNA